MCCPKLVPVRSANMHHPSPRKITRDVWPPPLLSRTFQSNEHTFIPGRTASWTQSGHGPRPETTTAAKASGDKPKRSPDLTHTNLSLPNLPKEKDSYSGPPESRETRSSRWTWQDRKHHATSLRPAKFSANTNQNAASHPGLGRFASEPLLEISRTSSLASVSSKSSHGVASQRSLVPKTPGSSKPSAVNRTVQRNPSNPTTSGSRFYASVIKSAMEKADNVRRHKKLKDCVAIPPIRKNEATKDKPEFSSHVRKLSGYRQPKHPPCEMHIIAGLALFLTGLLIACMQIATSMYRSHYGSDITPIIAASISKFPPKLSEIMGVDMIKSFGWIAALLQVLVLPNIFPTPFGLIREGFQASETSRKRIACVCVCVCVCVLTCTSYV